MKRSFVGCFVVLFFAAIILIISRQSFAYRSLGTEDAGGAGRAAVPEGPEGKEGVTHAVQHHEKHSGAKEQEKDPLQFGPLKVALNAMLRVESTNNFSFADFTFAPKNNDQRVLLRFRPSLALTPTDYLNAHVEGQWYAFYNDDDLSRVNLYQGYLEGGLPNKKATLKAGRQELVYGSTFMLGADTFFDGLSFDAAKLSVKPIDSLSADFFAGKYVKANSGGIKGEIYGVYGNYIFSNDLGIDLYGLLDTGGEGLTHEGKDERTYSVGARLTGKIGKLLALEAESVYQFGRKINGGGSHHSISAFGSHVDLTIDPALGRYPSKGFLSYAFGSGDGNPDEGKFSEFHNPNNDTPLIGDMSVVGDISGLTVADRNGNEIHASGLHVFTVGGGMDVTEKLNISLDGHYFKAVKTPAGISKDVGFEMNLILTYKLTDQICLLASVNRFFTGQFFKDATGSDNDINYGYLQLQVTF